MSTDEIIKEKIIAETAKLQIHLVVIIALSGGLYSLIDKLQCNNLNKIIFGVGAIFLVFFAIAVLFNYFSIRNNFEKLDKGGKKNV